MAKRSVKKRLFFSLTAVFLFFAIAEGILQLIRFEVHTGDVGSSDAPFFYHMATKTENMDTSLILGVHALPLTPENYRIDKPVEPKGEGVFRVVCLGDSSTIGDQVQKQEAYCDQLGMLLREKFAPREVETINAGFYGYSSYQGLEILKAYHRQLQPDALIFYFGANDANFAPMRQDKDWDKVPAWTLKLNHILWLHSKAYQFLRNINYRYLMQSLVHPFNEEARKSEYRMRVGIDDFFANFEAVKKIVNGNGGKVYMVPYTSVIQGKVGHAIYFDRALPDSAIDIEKEFQKMLGQGEQPYMPDGIHPSPAGHRKIAALLAHRIVADFLQTKVEN